MADSESLRRNAYSPTPFSTWLGIVFLFAVFGLIVLAVIGPSPRGNDYEEARAKKRMEKLKALHEENQKALTTYAWVDKNKGVARIPIDRAMELTVVDLAQKKPAPAGPIVAPSPAQASSPSERSPAAGSPSAATAQPSPKTNAAGTGVPGAPGAERPAVSSPPPTNLATSPSPAAQDSPSASASPVP